MSARSVVTLYELEPAPGIKSARVIGLAIHRPLDERHRLPRSVIPKNAIGIELPNARREMVYLRELLAGRFREDQGAPRPLPRQDHRRRARHRHLARMPHLLVADHARASRYRSTHDPVAPLPLTPDDCRLIMIDPKMLELSTYDGIPLLTRLSPTRSRQSSPEVDRARNGDAIARCRSSASATSTVQRPPRQARTKKETLTRTVQTGSTRIP